MKTQIRIFAGIEGDVPPLSADDLVLYLKRQGIAADVVAARVAE